MEGNRTKTGQNAIGFLLWAYFIVAQIMAIYFWWQYAKEDSFLATISVDVLLAELKGFLWIFFIW